MLNLRAQYGSNDQMQKVYHIVYVWSTPYVHEHDDGHDLARDSGVDPGKSTI